MKLALLYRGQLSSCNYGCAYCPFAKHRETRAELARDRRGLERFVQWAAAREGDSLSILFTPWGEALVRACYRDAMVTLSRLPHVARVAAQTNLSAPLGRLLELADPSRLALWCTYHPEWTTRSRFLAKLAELDRSGVRYSVGRVGFRRFLPEARAMRQALRPDVYLWINAAKGSEIYREEDVVAFEAIDPLFRANTVRHPTRGIACRTGEDVVSVDGDGVVRRCHFVREPIGRIDDGSFDAALRARACPQATCDCHIGYVHVPALGLGELFGHGILERIPTGFPWAPLRADAIRALATRLTSHSLPIARTGAAHA